MLREELRKVQASVILLERQRNPRVGPWNASLVDTDKNVTSSGPSHPPLSEPTLEGDVNYQYLRNIILQFLEHKDMRVSHIKFLIATNSTTYSSLN